MVSICLINIVKLKFKQEHSEQDAQLLNALLQDKGQHRSHETDIHVRLTTMNSAGNRKPNEQIIISKR